MALWGTDGDASTNKPKWCPDDANSKYDVTTVFGNQSGWVRRAGTSATGNGNTDADPEILVAIGGLAGATASTGLKHPTMTKYRILTSTAHGGSNNITFELRNSGGNVIDDTTLNISSGQQRIDLNFEVPVGTDMQLGVANNALQTYGLYRNNNQGALPSYPYNIASAISKIDA